MAHFISTTNLCRTYITGNVETHALEEVNLTVEAGEVVVLLGPSGSGKSTLLNLIGGIDRPTKGTITVAGTEITALNGRALTEFRRGTTGFIFQFYNLLPNLTVTENVEVAARLVPDPLEIGPLLDQLGIQHLAEKFPAQLSGGEQQRVAIARALVERPQLLLCDEPTGALDSAASKKIAELLVWASRTFSTTLLIVTHNPVLAQAADRVITMKDGRVTSNEVAVVPVAVSDIEW